VPLESADAYHFFLVKWTDYQNLSADYDINDENAATTGFLAVPAGTPEQEGGNYLFNMPIKENLIPALAYGERYVLMVRGKDKNGNPIFENPKNMEIDKDLFLSIAGTAYSETGYNNEAIMRLPFAVINRFFYNKSLSLEKSFKYMRNDLTDNDYANGTKKTPKNSAFRAFSNMEEGEKIVDFDKNLEERNNNDKMILAISYTIKALLYLKGIGTDISEKAIGWHGADILNHEDWKKWLYINDEHKKYSFLHWKNLIKLKNAEFESVSVFKGEGYLKKSTTIFYKSTK